MAFWDKEEEIITIDKNKAEKIKFSYVELKGKKSISLTFLKEKGEEGFKPIGGTSFGIDEWPKLKEAIDTKLAEVTVEDKA
jgi:hypothetical protein